MVDSQSSKTRKNVKRSDPKTLARFVQELSWLLSSYEELDYKALSMYSNDLLYNSNKSREESKNNSQPNHIHLLVGILPNLLVDEALFPSNEDISEFAFSALGISIPRWQKKSRYELIGHIVCHTNLASPSQLEQIKALTERALDEKDTTKDRIKRERNSGRSWNEVIQSLVRDNK